MWAIVLLAGSAESLTESGWQSESQGQSQGRSEGYLGLGLWEYKYIEKYTCTYIYICISHTEYVDSVYSHYIEGTFVVRFLQGSRPTGQGRRGLVRVGFIADCGRIRREGFRV